MISETYNIAFDVTSDFVFGLNSHTIEDGYWRSAINGIRSGLLRNSAIAWLPILALGRLDRRMFPEARKGTKALWKWLDHIRAEREVHGGSDKDGFYFLNGRKDEETETTLTEGQIESNMRLMILGGE